MIRRFIVSLFLLPLLFNQAAKGQQLTIYTIPSPMPLNWRSPHTLFMSYIGNLLVHTGYPRHRHPLGHVIFELRDTARYALVGAVARSRAEMFNTVTKEHYGLGTLFTTFNGKLETSEDNFHQLIDRYPKGDLAYIKFLLNEETFLHLWRYLDEYRERGYDTMYNGHNKPREGKGAGCSALAISFLELGGLLDSTTLLQWRVTINIQDKLIGGPEGDHKNISILPMAFTQRWADTAKQAYHRLSYYEPTYIYNWINTAWQYPDSSMSYGIGQRGKAKGIIIDRRDLPTPNGGIWLTPGK
ncbi:MAG: hypothetical protein BGO69_18280 [Bacteroidetes bacterium 46-16]|nr:MAG: hypothetical protein BGO69_18280 [Bacteroidetes bacterium 46-16]